MVKGKIFVVDQQGIAARLAWFNTGVFGMAVGDVLFLRLAIRAGMAKGAGFGAASHGAGTARSYELGPQGGQPGNDAFRRRDGCRGAVHRLADVLITT